MSALHQLDRSCFVQINRSENALRRFAVIIWMTCEYFSGIFFSIDYEISEFLGPTRPYVDFRHKVAHAFWTLVESLWSFEKSKISRPKLFIRVASSLTWSSRLNAHFDILCCSSTGYAMLRGYLECVRAPMTHIAANAGFN